MIYFIKSEDYVKVGYTSNMKNRYKKYVTENPNPVTLLASMKGGFALEKEIHKRLHMFHHRGEWFKYNDIVRALISSFLEEFKDNIEPLFQKRKRDKYKHLKVLRALTEFATAAGFVDIQPHIKTQISKDLEISESTFSRHVTKLLKLKRITRIDSLYYLV